MRILYTLQLTNTNNELLTSNGSLLNDNAMSMVNLKGCESLLKESNNIPKEDPLIILKYEKYTNFAFEKNVQYEIYNPITFDKLNLDICNKNDIDIVIPVELNEDIEMHIVPGSEKNIKITTVEDLEILKALMHTSKESWVK